MDIEKMGGGSLEKEPKIGVPESFDDFMSLLDDESAKKIKELKPNQSALVTIPIERGIPYYNAGENPNKAIEEEGGILEFEDPSGPDSEGLLRKYRIIGEPRGIGGKQRVKVERVWED